MASPILFEHRSGGDYGLLGRKDDLPLNLRAPVPRNVQENCWLRLGLQPAASVRLYPNECMRVLASARHRGLVAAISTP
jgi:hypothetical protein